MRTTSFPLQNYSPSTALNRLKFFVVHGLRKVRSALSVSIVSYMVWCLLYVGLTEVSCVYARSKVDKVHDATGKRSERVAAKKKGRSTKSSKSEQSKCAKRKSAKPVVAVACAVPCAKEVEVGTFIIPTNVEDRAPSAYHCHTHVLSSSAQEVDSVEYSRPGPRPTCSAVYTISVPGVYGLNGDYLGQIVIASNDVTLDLNGFNISNCSASPVRVQTGIANSTIRNGSMSMPAGSASNIPGIDLTASGIGGVVIENCSIEHCTGSGIALTNVVDATIRDCSLISNHYGIYATGPSIENIVVTQCSFNNNTIYSIALIGVGTARGGGCTIQNSLCVGGGGGINIGGGSPSYNCIIQDCTVIGVASNAYNLDTVSNSICTNCRAMGATQRGFYVSESIQITLDHCQAEGSTLPGFAIINATSQTIVSNCVAQNNGYGFRVATDCSQIVMNNCVAQNNLNHGFQVGGFSSNVMIMNCTANDNNGYGFDWDDSGTGNQFFQNIANQNGVNNYNSFINNTTSPANQRGMTNVDSASTTPDEIDTINDTVNTIDTTVNTINSTVTTIDTTVNTINSTVNTIDSTVNTINTNVDTLLAAEPIIIRQSDFVGGSGGTYTISNPGLYKLGEDCTGTIIMGSHNVTLDLGGYDLSNSGGTAVSINSSYVNVIIQNGSIGVLNAPVTGIDASYGGIENLIVANCVINNCSSVGITATNTINTVVQGCSFNLNGANNYDAGITISGTSTTGLVIEGCSGTDNYQGIALVGVGTASTGPLIIRNCSFGRGSYGFATFSDGSGNPCYHLVISDCSAAATSGNGFSFPASNVSVVARCTALNNSGSGFAVNGSVDIELSSCTAENNSGNGFNVTSSGKIVVLQCLANGNSGYGFNWDGSGVGNQFFQNIANQNSTGNYSAAITNTTSPVNQRGMTNVDSANTDPDEVDTINSTVSTIDTNVNAINSTVNTINGTVNTIDTAVNTINSTVNTIDTTVNTINTNVDTLVAAASTIITQSDFSGGTYTISSPGNYALSGNCTGSIQINSSDVILDLQGFDLSHASNAIVILAGSIKNVTVRNGSLGASGGSFGLLVGSSSTNDLLFTDLLILNCNYGMLFNGTSTNVALARCTFSACGTAGIQFYNTVGVSVIDSTFDGNPTGMQLVGALTDIVVRGCRGYSSGSGTVTYGIDIGNSTVSSGGTIIIQDCSFDSGSYGYHVNPSGSGLAYILNNCSAAGNSSNGFYISNTDQMLVQSCVAEGNSGNGFNINNSSNVMVNNCIANNNGSYGFTWDGAGTDNQFYQNIANDNTTANFSASITNVASAANQRGMANVDSSSTTPDEVNTINSTVNTINTNVDTLVATAPTIITQSDFSGGMYTISSPGNYGLFGSCTGSIHINSSDVILDLQGFDLSHASNNIIILAGNTNNITVRNGSLGANGGGSQGIAIGSSATNDLVFTDLVVLSCNYGMVFNGSSTNVTIARCTFSGSVTAGVQFCNSVGVSVIDSMFDGNPTGIQIVCSNGDIVVRGCTGYSSTDGAVTYGIYSATGSTISGSGLIIQDCAFDTGVYGYYVASPSQNVLFTNCSATGNSSDGFHISDAGQVLIQACTAQHNGGNGFAVQSSSNDVIVESCVANVNGAYGFYWDGNGTDNQFFKNIANDNTAANYSPAITNTTSPANQRGMANVNTANTTSDEVNTINSTVNTIDTTVNSINSTVTTINSTVNTIDTTVNTINSTVTTINGTVNTIDTTVNSINSTVNTIDTTVNTINTNVDTLVATAPTIITQSDFSGGTYTISSPGNYGLFGNCTGSIQINSSDVILDLQGFDLSHASNNIIILAGNTNNITVRNGSLGANGGGSQGIAVGSSATNDLVFTDLVVLSCNYGMVFNGTSTNVALARCTLSACGTAGIQFDNTIGASIVDSTFDANPTGLQLIGNLPDIVVRGCTGYSSSNGTVTYGIYIAGTGSSSGGIVIQDCAFDTGGYGYYVTGSAYNLLMNNCSAKSNTNDGFHIDQADRIVIQSCIAQNSTGNGFFIDRSSNVMVNNCIANNNGNYGFYWDGTGTNNQFYQNIASDNPGGGNFASSITNVTSAANQRGMANVDSSNTTSDEVNTINSTVNTINTNVDTLVATAPTIITQSDFSGGTYTISSPGNYGLFGNCTGSIQINSSDVILDLQGFDLSHASNVIITLAGSIKNVTVRNGSLGASGGLFGLLAGSSSTNDLLFTDLLILNCSYGMLFSGTSINVTVASCTFSACGTAGIQFYNTVGVSVIDSTFDGNPTGIQLLGNLLSDIAVRRCKGYSTTDGTVIYGIYIADYTSSNASSIIVQDCAFDTGSYGYYVNPPGSGLAYILNNCSATGNSNSGFYVANAANVQLNNCSALMNSTYGFYLDPSVQNGIIQQCIAINNGTGFSGTTSSGAGSVRFYQNIGYGNTTDFSAGITIAAVTSAALATTIMNNISG